MSKRLTWRVPKSRLFSTPIPPETRTYKPISHKELAETTIQAIKEAGFKLGAQEYSAAKEGKEATARYTIKDFRDSEMELEIGWQNSYNKQLSLKFAIGTRILICSNGCVSGNFGSFKKKHVGGAKDYVLEEIKKIIAEANVTFERMKAQRDEMKSIPLGREGQAALIGKLFLDKQLINSNQINIIKEEMQSPTHDYKSSGSLWEIYQHTTFSMKHLHPRLWMDDHILVHKFFVKEMELLAWKKDKPAPCEPEGEPIVPETGWTDPNQTDLMDLIDLVGDSSETEEKNAEEDFNYGLDKI